MTIEEFFQKFGPGAGGGDKKENPIHRNVHTLVSAISNLIQMQNLVERDADTEMERDAALDGGVHLATSMSIINLCSRLDLLAEDDEAWAGKSMSEAMADDLEVEVQAKQLEAATEHLAGVKQAYRPCYLLKPAMRCVEGIWWAVYGDGDLEGKLVGTGKTPEEALADFDINFKKANDDQKTVD